MIYVIIGIVIAVILGIFITMLKWKCPNCKKFGLQKIKTEEVERYNATTKVKDKVKSSDGELLTTIERTVPITKIMYKDTYKCKYCGHEITKTREERKE